MRTRKSVLNTIVSFISQLIIILLGFLSRRVLIYNVGVQYLGINGLMTNILTVFSLAESGIGIAIGYALYKPLAEKDTEKIKSLMRFFKVTYRLLALMTAIIGVAFYPFLPFFLKGNTAPDASTIYFLFLFSSVVSYLWVYKTTLNSSDQNKYLYTIANTITQILVLVLKIVILYYMQNYIFYLLVDIISTVIKNVLFSMIIDRRYPYLKEKDVQPLDVETRKNIFKNIKALFIGKVGYIISECSDNLVISSIVNITALGMYSNYTTIISAVSGFVTTFSSGVTASMGNLIASESSERAYEVYKKIDFINYWLYTFSAICLYCLIELFVRIWLGDEYVLSKSILFFAISIYYLRGINSSVDIVKNAAGLYYPDRFIPMVEAIVNLIISVILAWRIGLAGVLAGTLFSFLMFSFWTKPYFVYRDVFKQNFLKYVVWEGKKLVVGSIISVIVFIIQDKIVLSGNIVTFVVKAIVAFGISNGFLVLAYFRTKEFMYIKELLKSVLHRMISKNYI